VACRYQLHAALGRGSKPRHGVAGRAIRIGRTNLLRAFLFSCMPLKEALASGFSARTRTGPPRKTCNPGTENQKAGFASNFN
jgi:hypothetical protein